MYSYVFIFEFEENVLDGKEIGYLMFNENKIKFVDFLKYKKLVNIVERFFNFNGSIVFDLKVCNFIGVVYMGKGNIVLVDNENGNLKFFGEEGKFRYNLSCGDVKYDVLWDIIFIDDDYIVVIFLYWKKVCIYRIWESIVFVWYFEIYGVCWGIVFYKDIFIVICFEMGKFKVVIKFIDKCGKILKILYGDKIGMN